MASSIVYIGSASDPLFRFDDEDLTSISLENSLSIVGDELKIDTFEFDVCYTGEGDIEDVDYGTPVYFFRESTMIGKFYFIRATRKSQYNHKVYCESIIGLLDRETFYGGIYSNTSFKDVANAILSSNGLQNYYLYKKVSVPSSTNQDSVLLSEDGYGEAKMNSRMEVGVSYTPGSTVFEYRLAGSTAHGSSATDYDWNQTYTISVGWGVAQSTDMLYALLTYGRSNRASISISISSSELSVSHYLEISVDPGNAVFSVTYNGQVYSTSFSTDEANPDHITPLYVFGGKSVFSNKNTSTGKYTTRGQLASSGTVDIHYYRVYSAAGDLLIDAEPVKDIYTGYLYVRNRVTNYRSRLTNCTVQDADINYSSEDLDVVRASYDLVSVLEGTQYINGTDDLVLNGWIPVLSKRQALQQILFASGVNLLKGSEGELIFTILTDQTAEAIPDSSIYIEGEVEYPSKTNAIDVTEFSYETLQENEVEVFNNQDAASVPDVYIAVFNSQPVFRNITSEGIEILTKNANAAVVRGQGKIMGHPYVRSETVVSAVLGDRPDGKTIAITDVGLVNFTNSSIIVDRLKRYYRDAHTAKPHIDMTTQKCGSKYSFTNAFREPDSGFLTKISCIMSTKIKAACEIVCGFIPSGSGSEYSHFALLTGSGTWDVPSEVFEQETPKIKAVLIGGGKGGYSGRAGDGGTNIHPDPDNNNWKSTTRAEGGDPGAPGTGGKVLVITIENPAAQYTYTCGAGGAGGQPSGQYTIPGSNGGNTTFSGNGVTSSSASGTTRANGIANEITGRVYARPGASWAGRRGGKGGAGGYYTIQDNVVTQFAAEAVHNELTGYTAPAGAKGADYIVNGSIVSLGGCGGGAAGGYLTSSQRDFPGKDGDEGRAGLPDTGPHGGAGGDGGSGLTYTPPAATNYGDGGMGGVGGGGGGAGGGTNPDLASPYYPYVPGGQGGSGGPGGSGAAGCIIIYY